MYIEPENSDRLMKISVTVSGGIDTDELCTIFEDQGIQIDEVSGFFVKSAEGNEVLRYLIHVLVASPGHVLSTAEGLVSCDFSSS